MKLNEKQEMAKNKVDWPLLIIAWAWSGKTATLTARVEYMIKEVWIDPKSILCVTFTNKAAREMRERIWTTLWIEITNNIYRQRNLPLIWTFHSIWVFFLREILDNFDLSEINFWLKKEFLIYSEEDKFKLLKEIIVNDLKLDEKSFPARKMAYFISEAKNNFLNAKKYKTYIDSYIKEKVSMIYDLYEKKMTENNALDFDDILFKTLELLKLQNININDGKTNFSILEYFQEKYKYIMIDEYQDTNMLQYEIIKLLASKYRNLAVVGDDWQCLIPDTKIISESWEKSIQDLSIWEKILSYDGENKKKFREITNIYKNSIKEDIYEIKTKSWKSIKTTKNHIFFANPEDNNDNYEYAIYLMYKQNYGYRIWFTRYKWLWKIWNILWIRKRLNWERADYAWILETTNEIKKAKYLEQLYSFKYSIPQTVFYTKWKLKELDEKDVENIYKSINTKKNVELLFDELKINKKYPHIIASSTNRFDSTRININFLMMWWNAKNRRFGMYRVTLHSSNENVIETLKNHFPNLCRKSKLGIIIDKELADYDKIRNLTQEIYKVLDENWFNVIINERLSFVGKSYIFLPASNLKKWFWIWVFNEKKWIYEKDEIIKINKIDYIWEVYDLDISRTHNFVANEILVHNSIYSWRGADMRNILNFKKDYPDAIVVKLEQNYRSTKCIIDAANCVVKNNKTALEKTLWTDNETWEKIYYIEAIDDSLEAETIAQIIKEKQKEQNSPLTKEAREILDENISSKHEKWEKENSPLIKGARGISDENLKTNNSISLNKYSDNLILYRTNWQSRQIEEALMKNWIPYKVVWWLKFYDRKEIKDLIWYLRVIHNPNDVISFKRIINTPSRKIWARTLEVLDMYRANFNLSYFQILQNAYEIPDLNSWAKNNINNFVNIILNLIENSHRIELTKLINYIVDKTWYKQYLQAEYSKEEYEWKIDNITELVNLASNYNWMEPREALSQFLEEISLVSDLDNVENDSDYVTLMTIHTSKWLEQKRVFIAWVEDSIFPHIRSIDSPSELEEERRLMYVAMTRAKKELYISRAKERFYFWNYVRNLASRFIKEIPSEFLENYETNTFSFSKWENNFWGFQNFKGDFFNHSNISWSNKEPQYRAIPKIRETNNLEDFSVWDKLNHHKFGTWIITELNWEIAHIAFENKWIIKMNIKIAPVKKI